MKLFAAETDSSVFGVIACLNVKHKNFKLLAAFENITGLFDSGPANIADMHKSFNAVFDFNECAEVR